MERDSKQLGAGKNSSCLCLWLGKIGNKKNPKCLNGQKDKCAMGKLLQNKYIFSYFKGMCAVR